MVKCIQYYWDIASVYLYIAGNLSLNHETLGFTQGQEYWNLMLM